MRTSMDSSPLATERFRDQTKHQASMAGCMMPGFRCPKCKAFATILGRKKIDGRFVCGKCAAA